MSIDMTDTEPEGSSQCPTCGKEQEDNKMCAECDYWHAVVAGPDGK